MHRVTKRWGGVALSSEKVERTTAHFVFFQNGDREALVSTDVLWFKSKTDAVVICLAWAEEAERHAHDKHVEARSRLLAAVDSFKGVSHGD
jgi:hypothetical protein